MMAVEYHRREERKNYIDRITRLLFQNGKKKKKQQQQKSLLTNLQINAERWLQNLVITCEIWGIHGVHLQECKLGLIKYYTALKAP